MHGDRKQISGCQGLGGEGGVGTPVGMGFYLGVTENVLELAEVTVARACECAKWQ